jgi:hypothetical protein
VILSVVTSELCLRSFSIDVRNVVPVFFLLIVQLIMYMVDALYYSHMLFILLVVCWMLQATSGCREVVAGRESGVTEGSAGSEATEKLKTPGVVRNSKAAKEDKTIFSAEEASNAESSALPDLKWLSASGLDVKILTSGVRKVKLNFRKRCVVGNLEVNTVSPTKKLCIPMHCLYPDVAVVMERAI